MAIYFAKDVLVAVVYLSFFLAYRRKRVALFRPPFLVPLLLFVWFGVMQTFNPASTSLIFGVLGLKLFFYYVPLLFVGYALLNSEEQLRRFFFVNIILVLIIGSLGIAQSILGHTFLNPERPAEDIRELSTNYRVSPISGLLSYRPTSVFVSTGRFGNFLLVSLLLIVGFLGYLLLRHKKGRHLTFFSLAIVSGAIVLGAFGYERWPYGYGIGTTSLGTQYVARFFGSKPPVIGVESGFGTIVLEMGIGGLVLWFVMSFAILFSAWRVVKKLRGSPWFPLAFVIFWYAGLLLLPMTFAGMQPYQDFVLNAYLWLLLGILFRLPTLAVSVQYAAAQSPQTYAPRIR